MKKLILITFTLTSITICNSQVNAIKNKLQAKIQNAKPKSSMNTRDKGKIYTVEEIDQNPYETYDRIFLSEKNTPIIIKGMYQKDFKDDIGLSGYYYLNSVAIKRPSSHFSSDTTKFYSGFSINYSKDKHTLQVYWEELDSNYAMIPEKYHSSADKGNVMFQMGMTGGPESYFNAKCLLLEPEVVLIGANVYHKNDDIGHQWMNNVSPDFFVIAAKDTSKFNDYQLDTEFTSKVVFEKFDALRKAWKEKEITDAKPLPAEGMKDAKLKSESLNLIKKTAQAYGWKEEVEYAYITSNNWEVRISQLTGKPLTRSIKCIVVMKTPQGNYKREGFYIGQKYIENKWGPTYMLYNDQRIFFVNPKDAYKYKNS